MTRLIDADALNKKLCETTIFIEDGEVFQRMINDAPTIEQTDGDLISRQDALDILDEFEADIEVGKKDAYKTHREKLLSIHSAYHPLYALADRECPFQGKEFAWCLTCPHISEEDKELVKKAVAEPKTGEWVLSHIGTIAEGYYCSRCGKHGYQTDFCPNCGADMRKGGDTE